MSIGLRLACAVALALGTGGCGLLDALPPGCDARAWDLAAALGELAVLEAHPSSAVPEPTLTGCDEDSGFASASRDFASPAKRPEILEFYREAAAEDGWTAAGKCYTRSVNGAAAYLRVWYLSDLDVPGETSSPTGVYSLTVTATHEGDAGC